MTNHNDSGSTHNVGRTNDAALAQAFRRVVREEGTLSLSRANRLMRSQDRLESPYRTRGAFALSR